MQNKFDEIISKTEQVDNTSTALDESLKEIRWKAKRVGRLGSSVLGDFVKSGRGKGEEFGEMAKSCLIKVKRELRTGKSAEREIKAWQMEHGKEHEPRALELTKEKYPGIIGATEGDEIIYRTYGNLFGDSPDFEGGRITGEIKCPVDPIKIELQREEIKFYEVGNNGKRKYHEYFWQMAGHLLANEKATICVYVVYDAEEDEIYTHELQRAEILDELEWLKYRLALAEITLSYCVKENFTNKYILNINEFIKTIENE